MTGVVKRVALAIRWRRQLARMRFCLAATSAAASATLAIGLLLVAVGCRGGLLVIGPGLVGPGFAGPGLRSLAF